jgi:glucose dehydrogenase
LQQITRENVSALREIGKYELQETTSFQSVPVVIGDAMYVATVTATYALNAVTGELLWSQTYTTQPTPRKM